MIGGMEVYTDKAALSIQMDEAWFQKYLETAKREEFFAKDEQLVVWYPTAGFVSRDDTAPPFGRGVVVITGMVTSKDGMRDKAVEAWGFVTTDSPVALFCILSVQF